MVYIVKTIRNSHFPFVCDFLGPASSVVFSTKTAIFSFITFSVGSLHLQYFHHVIIVHVMPYISIYLSLSYTDECIWKKFMIAKSAKSI